MITEDTEVRTPKSTFLGRRSGEKRWRDEVSHEKSSKIVEKEKDARKFRWHVKETGTFSQKHCTHYFSEVLVLCHQRYRQLDQTFAALETST